jgi:hypothetical protein
MIGGYWRQREHCCSTEASRCGNLCSWNATIVGPTQSYQSNQGSGTYQGMSTNLQLCIFFQG